jgi:hypothetical protein
MEPRKKEPSLIENELSQHYNSIFASVPSVFSRSEESILKFGYGLQQFYSVSLKILRRLQKNSINSWRDKVLQYQAQPLYYKYIETPSRIYFREHLLRSLLRLSLLTTNLLTFAFLKIHRFSILKTCFSINLLFQKLVFLTFKRKSQTFSLIKSNFFYFREKSFQSGRKTKRILAGFKKIKASFFRRLKEKISKKVDVARINSYRNIFRFKIYEKRVVLKIICILINLQKKKMCKGFLIWKTKAEQKTIEQRKRSDQEKKIKEELEEIGKISEFQGIVDEKTRGVVERQLESLLYGFAIDSFNGFLNL